jgi:capsular exopolysaccharide synthesis family protein
MTPFDKLLSATNEGAGGSRVPFAGTSPPFDSKPPFGTSSAFGSPLSLDGDRFNSSQDPLFSDPRQVIKKMLHIIRSRWLLAVFAGVMAGSASGIALFKARPIEATAETTLLAESPLDQILNPSGNSAADSDHQETTLTNHLSVMMSRNFIRRVAESFSPEQSLEIQRPYLKKGQLESLENLTAILTAKINVEREREKDFFTITVKHLSEPTALMIANRFTAVYLELVQLELRTANQAAANILGKQAAELSREINAIEDQRREYRRQHNLISAQENETILEDRIKVVNLARSDLRVQRAKLEAEVTQARDDLANSSLPFTNSTLSAYGGMQLLRQQLDSLLVEKDVLSLRYGPNHAKMLEVEGNVAATRAELVRNYKLAFADLQSQLDLAIEAEKGLNSEFDVAFNQSLELGRLATQLNALGQQADDKRKTLDDLFERIGKASIDKGLPADLLRIVDAGYIRRSLVPMFIVYLGIIGVFTVGAFGGVPLAVNFFDEKINENVDLESKLRVDVIGVIPRLGRVHKDQRQHIVRDNLDLLYAESFLNMASQVDLVSRKKIPRRIVVTSTLPGEGKSTLASNLASAYTRLGRKTVLVDCDFRKPLLRGTGNAECDSGLLNWARAGFNFEAGLLDVGGLVSATVLADGTTLIPAGASDHQPARFLIAEGMARFFALLGEEFEIVIVDTPPAGVFQDALIIARHCDDTLFLARAGKANIDQLTRILHDFNKTAAPAVGLVLNGFSATANNRRLGYRGQYPKYGSYGSAAREVLAEKP